MKKAGASAGLSMKVTRVCNEGETQRWETAYFFDDVSTSEQSDGWPDMLRDEISEEDIARYETAKRAGDPSTVIDLMHPRPSGQ